MSAPVDRSARRLARNLEVALVAVLVVLVYASLAGGAVERLVTVPTALGLGVVLLLNRLRGLPGYGFVRWVAGLTGAALLLGGIALFGTGVWLVVLGAYGILVAMVLVPLSLGMAAWGYTLLASALWRPDRGRRWCVDERRGGEAIRPGSGPESDSPDAPSPT